jgi:hypothetical protein
MLSLMCNRPTGIFMLVLFVAGLICAVLAFRSSSPRLKWYLCVVRIGGVILPLLGIVSMIWIFFHSFTALALAGGPVDKGLVYTSIAEYIYMIQAGIWMGIVLLVLYFILSTKSQTRSASRS